MTKKVKVKLLNTGLYCGLGFYIGEIYDAYKIDNRYYVLSPLMDDDTEEHGGWLFLPEELEEI